MSETKVPDYLLSSNQEANAENVALFHAAEKGDLSEIKKLIALGAKPNFFHRPEDQKNSLHIAAENAHEAVVQFLLEHGAVANSIAAADQSTAINLAARNTHTSRQLIEMLVDYGADPSHANCYGNTALHEAALIGNLAVAEALLGRGIQVTRQNNKGSTAFHSLCYNVTSSQSTLEMLAELLVLSDETVIDMPDKHGATPLLVCAASNNLVLLLWLLQKIQANPNIRVNVNARDDARRNAVDVALFFNHREFAEIIEKHLHSNYK